MSNRRKRNSSKVNLTISLIFHGGLVVLIMFLAAREGMLGKKLKQLTVTMVPKEKKPEPPKEKPPEPKIEPPKPVETPKVASLTPPPPAVQPQAPPPAVQEVPPMAAPAPVSLPAFQFSDGAKEVQTISDPNLIYKSLVEHALRSHWDRPEDLDDSAFVAEVNVTIDTDGNLVDSQWVKGSGNARWDNSVKAAVAATKVFSRPPPKGFPQTFLTRFDVASERTEPVLSLSSR